MKIAVAVYGFNRPDHIANLLQSISASRNFDSYNHYGFVDGARNEYEAASVQQVDDLMSSSKIFKKITKKETNIGLARSIISGVDELFLSYDAVIVLEDDLIISPEFYNYMAYCLERYKDDDRVFSISGFNYPQETLKIDTNYPFDTFFSTRPHSWGWATYKNRWARAIWDLVEEFDVFVDPIARDRFNRGGDDLTGMLRLQLEKKINSWAIRWAYTHYKLNKLALYPVHSHVLNNGFDGSGTHCRGSGFNNDLSLSKGSPTFPNKVELDRTISEGFKNVFSGPTTKIQAHKDIITRSLNFLKKIIP